MKSSTLSLPEPKCGLKSIAVKRDRQKKKKTKKNKPPKLPSFFNVSVKDYLNRL